MEAPPDIPAGWPVVERHLLMTYVERVLVIRIAADLSARGFSRYLEEWSRSVDARPDDAAVYAMYDSPSGPA